MLGSAGLEYGMHMPCSQMNDVTNLNVAMEPDHQLSVLGMLIGTWVAKFHPVGL